MSPDWAHCCRARLSPANEIRCPRRSSSSRSLRRRIGPADAFRMEITGSRIRGGIPGMAGPAEAGAGGSLTAEEATTTPYNSDTHRVRHVTGARASRKRGDPPPHRPPVRVCARGPRCSRCGVHDPPRGPRLGIGVRAIGGGPRQDSTDLRTGPHPFKSTGPWTRPSPGLEEVVTHRAGTTRPPVSPAGRSDPPDLDRDLPVAAGGFS